MYEKRIIELFEQYYSNIEEESKFIQIEEEELKEGRQIRIILEMPAKTQFIKHLDYLFGENGIVLAQGIKIIIVYLLK